MYVFVKVMVSTAKCINCLPIISNYHASTIKYFISQIIYIRSMVLWVIMSTLKSVYILLGMQPQNTKVVGTLLPFSSCLCPAYFPTVSFSLSFLILSSSALTASLVHFQNFFLILPFLYQTCLPRLLLSPSSFPFSISLEPEDQVWSC